MADEQMKLTIAYAWKFLIPFLALLSSCFSRPSNELEEMSEVVLKKKQGIDIQITPIEVPKK